MADDVIVIVTKMVVVVVVVIVVKDKVRLSGGRVKMQTEKGQPGKTRKARTHVSLRLPQLHSLSVNGRIFAVDMQLTCSAEMDSALE